VRLCTAQKRLSTHGGAAPASGRTLVYAAPMHLVLIAWLYVALMVAATEPNIVASVLSFSFYGLLPAAIIAYIGTTGQRKKRRRLKELAGEHDGAEAEGDQRDLSS